MASAKDLRNGWKSLEIAGNRDFSDSTAGTSREAGVAAGKEPRHWLKLSVGSREKGPQRDFTEAVTRRERKWVPSGPKIEGSEENRRDPAGPNNRTSRAEEWAKMGAVSCAR
jgi:hypothetical protein